MEKIRIYNSLILMFLLILNISCEKNNNENVEKNKECIGEIALVIHVEEAYASNIFILSGDELTYYLSEFSRFEKEYLTFKPIEKFPPQKIKLSEDELKFVTRIYNRGVDYMGDLGVVKGGKRYFLFFEKKLVANGVYDFEDSFHPDFKYIINLFTGKFDVVDLYNY